MKRFDFSKWSGVSALALVLFVSPGWARAIDFNSIVVFGGSVSDPGNFFALTGFANKPPYDELDDLLVPTGPYSVGGHHSSNGATWIEQFARPIGMSRYVQPAYKGASPHAANYAVAGARSIDVTSPDDTVDMPEQVDEFLQARGNVAPSDALYVIDFGGNDVRDALQAALLGGAPGPIIGNAVSSIVTHMLGLYAAGARKFLVVNVADIGQIPSIRILDGQLQAGGMVIGLATQLSEGFNTGLDALLAAFLPPDVELAKLDVFGTVRGLVADSSTFGLVNVTDACITPNVPPFSCKKPDQYLFWDGVHPTKAVHAIFADVAVDVLGP
jgi:phospholipase/lecithinase/hemolysin